MPRMTMRSNGPSPSPVRRSGEAFGLGCGCCAKRVVATRKSAILMVVASIALRLCVSFRCWLDDRLHRGIDIAVRRGQLDDESRAVTGLAVDIDRAAVCLHYPGDKAQPQPQALLLFREARHAIEPVEDMRQM